MDSLVLDCMTKITMIKKIKTVIGIMVLCLIFVAPYTTHAAYTYFKSSETGQIAAQDNVIIEVRFNTENQPINSIEGLVGIHSETGPIYVRQINLGGSDITLWPNNPSVSSSEKDISISFVGGTPGGFTKTDILLFSIVLTATEPGALILAPASIVAYAHDGQGTPITVRNVNLELVVAEQRAKPEDEWQKIITTDSEPPLPFKVTLGQDPSVFDGKKFISFYTTDNQSGIDHYEIKEGNMGIVRSSSPYVLRNQELELPITVYAFDRAGNVREAFFDPQSIKEISILKTSWFFLLSILILCCIIVVLWKQKRKKQ